MMGARGPPGPPGPPVSSHFLDQTWPCSYNLSMQPAAAVVSKWRLIAAPLIVRQGSQGHTGHAGEPGEPGQTVR